MIKIDKQNIIVGLIILFYITLMIYIAFEIDNKNTDCLEKIAKSYCENNNARLSNTFTSSFTCVEGRNVIETKHIFFQEEKENCRIQRGFR